VNSSVTEGEPPTQTPVNPIVQFQDHRTVLPAAQRVSWRLPLLVLVVGKFRKRTASLSSLHLIPWAMRSSATRHMLRTWMNGRSPADLISTRMEPNLDLTIRLAAAEGLVYITTSGRVSLTPRGTEFASLIDDHPDLMDLERELLSDIAPLNDTSIANRMGGAIDVA
jgi:hypothetical protein